MDEEKWQTEKAELRAEISDLTTKLASATELLSKLEGKPSADPAQVTKALEAVETLRTELTEARKELAELKPKDPAPNSPPPPPPPPPPPKSADDPPAKEKPPARKNQRGWI